MTEITGKPIQGSTKITLMALVAAAVLLTVGTAAAAPGGGDAGAEATASGSDISPPGAAGSGPQTTDTTSTDSLEPATSANGPSTSSVTTMATLVVDDNGNECPGAGFTTIDGALVAASDGDTVEVCPGTYTPSGAQYNVTNSSLTITGRPGTTARGPAANAPVVDLVDAKSGFVLDDGVSDVTIEGFNFTNGSSFDSVAVADGDASGRIITDAGTFDVTVQDSSFLNVAYGVYTLGDGGPSEEDERWTVRRNVFVDNLYAVYFEKAIDPTISNNHVSIEDGPVVGSDMFLLSVIAGASEPSSATVTDNVVDTGNTNPDETIGIYLDTYSFWESSTNPAEFDGVLVRNNTVRNFDSSSAYSIGILLQLLSNSNVRDATIVGNDVRNMAGVSTFDSGIDLGPFGSNQTVEDVTMRDNDVVNVTSTVGASGIDAGADGYGDISGLSVVGNRIEDITGTGGGDAIGIERDGSFAPQENVRIADNRISSVTGDSLGEGIAVFSGDSTTDFSIENNRINTVDAGNFSLGIEYDTIGSSGPQTNVVISENVLTDLRDGFDENFGILLDADPGDTYDGVRVTKNTADRTPTGNPVEEIDGLTLFEGDHLNTVVTENTFRDWEFAVNLTSTVTVDGVRINSNNFENAGSFGVWNGNASAVVDATNNYWGASDGPGSPVDPDAPFADPITGTLADGNGSNVSEGGTAGVSNVHFDPFATSPFEFGEDEQECVNRRDLGRGQEGQECPTDRGISRGESREDLDRSTGRNSDTRRRDRSRGERSRRGSRSR